MLFGNDPRHLMHMHISYAQSTCITLPNECIYTMDSIIIISVVSYVCKHTPIRYTVNFEAVATDNQLHSL